LVEEKSINSNTLMAENLLPKKKKSCIEYFRNCYKKFVKENKYDREKEIYDENFKRENRKSLCSKKKGILREIIQMDQMNEWETFLNSLKEKIKEDTTSKRIMSFFGEDASFIKIWRGIFSAFVVFIVYMYFFKHICLEIDFEKSDILSVDCPSLIKVYMLINWMYIIDFVITVIQLFIPKSWIFRIFTIFVILPIKFAIAYPYDLHYNNLYFLFLKFIRLDLIVILFFSMNSLFSHIIAKYIHVTWFKLTMVYLNEIMKYLLIFALYGHFLACLFILTNSTQAKDITERESSEYVYNLYLVFYTFSTVGYGDIDIDKNRIESILLSMISFYIGVCLFSSLTNHIYLFFIDLKENRKKQNPKNVFKNFVFKIERNTNVLMPRQLKNVLYAYDVVKNKVYGNIFLQYSHIFKMCRNDISKHLVTQVLEPLRKELSLCFQNCSNDFFEQIFKKVKPKIFSPGKILIKYADKVDKLYFLLHGTVEMITQNENNFIRMEKTTMFGDNYFLRNMTSDYTYKVADTSFAIILYIKKHDYIKIANEDIKSNQELTIRSMFKDQYYSFLEKQKFGICSFTNNFFIDENNSLEKRKEFSKRTKEKYSQIKVIYYL
jgi:hypothetical protein